MKRLASTLVAMALVASIGLAIILSSESRDEPVADVSLAPSAERSAPASPPASEGTVPAPFSYGVPGSASPSSPGQSRLWVHDDHWWGVFLTAESGDQRIFRLDVAARTWIDTGTIVDDRVYARMDVVSDGERLFVASAGHRARPGHALRITRLTYDPTAETYRRDPNFPTPITDLGVEALTLARTTDGRLWVAYRQGLQMAIDHSLDSELAWRGPFVPTAAAGPIEAVALASMGDRVAVVWTRPSEDTISMAWHEIEGPPDVWVSSPDAEVLGLRFGEDLLSVATDRSPGAERLFVAAAISARESPDRGRLDPQLVLVEFVGDGPPTSYLVGRVEDGHTDPIIQIDSEARELRVVAASPEVGGSIYYKVTSLDRLSFPSGRGTLLIPATDAHPRLAYPTSTKQAIDRMTGMVVAAIDRRAGLYGFGALGLEHGTAASAPPEASQPATQVLVDNTFDGLAVGANVPGWVVDGDPAPPFVIRVLTGSDSSARLSSTATSARACVSFGPVSSGRLMVAASTLFNLATEDELHLLDVRGGAGEIVSIRLRDRAVRYSDGSARIDSELVLVPGRWYRSILTLDLGTFTYGLELRDAATGSVLVDQEGMDWRFRDSSSVNRACSELPPDPGLDLYLDDVLVTSSSTQD